MMSKKSPQLRFEGFTEEWEERKLGEISRMYQPLTITGNDLLPDGVPVFGANGFIGFFSEANHIEDQVTISARGEGTGTPSYVHGPVWITGNSMVVNVDDFDINKYFLFANLTANSLKKYVTGGAQPQLTRDVLVKVPITLPNADEQQKIGSFFKQVDDTIALHQRKIDLLKEQKKGYLQKMFPKNGEKVPELRFEGFTDAWEECKLGDEVQINGRIGFRGYTQADIVTKETGVLAYSPTNIVNNRLYRKQSDTYITKQKYIESPEIMVKNSDILFVKTGSTLGKSALVQGINYQATVNPQIVIIRSNELDEYFLSVVLTSYNILKRINTIKIGGAIPTMTETELKKFPIHVPKSTEQKKIGSFFKKLDETITLHQRKLDLLKEQKKGFLQKMFV